MDSNVVITNNDTGRITWSIHKALCIGYSSFANMTAGHIVILALLGLIFILNTYVVVRYQSHLHFLYFLLEILAAFFSVYFTMLSGLFIGMAVHQEH